MLVARFEGSPHLFAIVDSRLRPIRAIRWDGAGDRRSRLYEPEEQSYVSVHSYLFRDRNTKKLTDADKGRIIAILQSGRSVVNLAAELNLNKRTVALWGTTGG
jgi:hypothetical protein